MSRSRKGAAKRAEEPASRPSNRGLGNTLISFLILAVLLIAVNLLPPDTSLQEVKRRGSLRVCIPQTFPPLVYSPTADAPGIEIELLQAVARELDLNLLFFQNQAIGRDFNPRNWRVTRAQCEVIAGGVVASDATRSFLETTTPHMSTGWAVVFTGSAPTLRGATVGFYAGVTGLDRIALSRFLQAQGAEVAIVPSSGALAAGLSTGEYQLGVTESLTARQISSDIGGTAMWLPEELGRYPIAFGLWKGDLTLKRAIESSLASMRSSGELDNLIEAYDVGQIEDECGVCS